MYQLLVYDTKMKRIQFLPSGNLDPNSPVNPSYFLRVDSFFSLKTEILVFTSLQDALTSFGQ